MGFSFNTLQSDILDEYITVRKAAEISGYNQQYLRRLLRENNIHSERLGQFWLINRDSFMDYLNEAKRSRDKRFRPQHEPVNNN